MKKLALVALLLTPFSVQANMTCPTLSELAETIMQGRQEGVPLRKMMEIGANSPEFLLLTKSAYRDAPMVSKDGKRRQRTEFGNYWLKICLEADEKLNKEE